MSSSFQAFASSDPNLPSVNTNNSIECPSGPSDGISALAWHPEKNIFACASWDHSLTVYDVNNVTSQISDITMMCPKPTVAFTQHAEGPLLATAFSAQNNTVLAAGCDNCVRVWDLETHQQQYVGEGHAAPVKEVFWVEPLQLAVTGSWDKTLRFWDVRSGNAPIAQIDLPEKVYSMDIIDDVVVAGLAERRLQVYLLSELSRMGPSPIKDGETALKLQTRCVACFPDKKGYAVGSIEGRCSIAYLESSASNFAFKCHRTTDEIFAVNAICFHPVHGTFCTAGADGNFVFWDKDNRQRLKAFNSCNAPITAAKFNAKGDFFAYAVSYDQDRISASRKVLLHRVDENEVKPKAQSNRSSQQRRT